MADTDDRVKDESKALGGHARAQALPQEKRVEIARKAARARWHGLPKATHTGVLRGVVDSEIPCYVLENGERVLSTRGIMMALGRSWRGRKYTGTELPVFLEARNLLPFVSNDLRLVLAPVQFRLENGLRGEGFRAQVLPAVCEIYLLAKDQGDVLQKNQVAIARRCEIMIRGLSRVGIIALVDEATGYQYDRARNELSIILKNYVSEELLPWLPRFPDEFFRQIYRLQEWEYTEGKTKHPRYVGKLINKYIYEPLPPGVLDELRRRNPMTEKGWRRHKHHQLLTADTGVPHLDRQLTAVITLFRVANDKAELEELFKRAFGAQRRLELVAPAKG